MNRPTLIRASNGQEVLASDVDHLNITKKSDGTKSTALITKQGVRYPINEDEISYFIEKFNFPVQIFDPKS